MPKTQTLTNTQNLHTTISSFGTKELKLHEVLLRSAGFNSLHCQQERQIKGTINSAEI